MNSKTGKETKNYERKPNHEFKVTLSKDKKYWIFKNIVTWIVPTNYLGTIAQSTVDAEVSAAPEQLAFEAIGVGK